MYRINDDYSISLAQGDTLLFVIELSVGDEETPARFPDGTVGVFALKKQSSRSTVTPRAANIAAGLRVASVEPVYVTKFAKAFKLEVGYRIIVYLSNAETRALETGDYYWDVRIVTDPEYNDDGSVKCDDVSDQVVSAFSGGDPMPKFTITEVATIV